MRVDWDAVSTELSGAQVESAYSPVGRFVLIHTQFDLLIGRLVTAFSGLGDNQVAQHLIHALDAGTKKKIVESVASIYGSDPNGLVPDYKPMPELRARLKKVAQAFNDASKIRNVLAHGTLGRLDERVFIGSMSAASFFKNTGGAESWVFIDTIDDHVLKMLSAMDEGSDMQRDFKRAHALAAADAEREA